MSLDYYDESADWSIIPEHMHGAIRRYVMHGVPPGSFLTAVLSNDLKESYARADDDNAASMRGWVRFLYNFCPSHCHGAPDAVASWIDRGGLNGRAAA